MSIFQVKENGWNQHENFYANPSWKTPWKRNTLRLSFKSIPNHVPFRKVLWHPHLYRKRGLKPKLQTKDFGGWGMNNWFGIKFLYYVRELGKTENVRLCVKYQPLVWKALLELQGDLWHWIIVHACAQLYEHAAMPFIRFQRTPWSPKKHRTYLLLFLCLLWKLQGLTFYKVKYKGRVDQDSNSEGGLSRLTKALRK